MRAKAPQRQASVPGSCPRLGPLPPASPMALTDQHCTQVLAAGSLGALCNLVGGGWREGCLLRLLLGCGLSVGMGPGEGHHGSPPTTTPPARHLPKKTLLPTPPLRPVPATRGTGLPGWTLLCSAFSHCLSSAASGPASSSRKAGVPLSAAFRDLHRFLSHRRSGVGSGLILNQSNMGSLSASPCVDGNCSAHSYSHIQSTVSVPGLTLSFTFTMVYNVHNTPTIWVLLFLPSLLLRGKMDLESEARGPLSHSGMWNQHS